MALTSKPICFPSFFALRTCCSAFGARFWSPSSTLLASKMKVYTLGVSCWWTMLTSSWNAALGGTCCASARRRRQRGVWGMLQPANKFITCVHHGKIPQWIGFRSPQHMHDRVMTSLAYITLACMQQKNNKPIRRLMLQSNTLNGTHIKLCLCGLVTYQLSHMSWQRLVQSNLLHLMFSVTIKNCVTTRLLSHVLFHKLLQTLSPSPHSPVPPSPFFP